MCDDDIVSPRPAIGSSDASELRRLHAQIAELTEAVAARDAFLGVAAHELRNPMTPIIGQVQLIRRWLNAGTATPERLAAGLERLDWMTEHFIRRATTLLDVSRLTTGDFVLRQRTCQVGSIVAQVAERYAPVALLAKSPIRVDASGPIALVADPDAIERIADNLVSNAVKHGAGQPIDLSADRDETHAIIRVTDRGAGITEESRSRIFERFERAVGAGTYAGGLGVGLWIVAQLTTAMGGEISVESSPGRGSTFTVRFPLHGKGSDDER